MKFRLRAFALHLLASASVLTLVLGSLYLGWYRWPGWYVAGASGVVLVLVAVDLTIGPLMTLVIARATKPRRELARDIAIIATVQLCALLYGAVSLWHGRPLYYAFSQNELQLVQASDISSQEMAIGRQHHAAILPHWYSLPRWIWAPLPDDPAEAQRIVMSVFSGGDDVICMPRYFRQWQQGLPALRKQLQKLHDVRYFSSADKRLLEARMRALGLDGSQANALPLIGRGDTVLVVFDPETLKIRAMIGASHPAGLELPRLNVHRYLQALLDTPGHSHSRSAAAHRPES